MNTAVSRNWKTRSLLNLLRFSYPISAKSFIRCQTHLFGIRHYIADQAHYSKQNFRRGYSMLKANSSKANFTKASNMDISDNQILKSDLDSNFFEPYISDQEAKAGLQSGRYYQGVCRINRKRRTEAYVTVKLNDLDWLIPSEKDRNRAFDGDTVVLEKLAEGSENSGSSKLEDDDQGKFTRARVVYILDRKIPHTIPGFISIPNWLMDTKDRQSDTKISRVLFVPQNNIWPYFLIDTNDLKCLKKDKNLYQLVSTKMKKLFTIKVKHWGLQRFPNGILFEELGNIATVDAETKAIFAEYDIDYKEYEEAILSKLPKDWKVEESEVKKRKDFRDVLTITIDPKTARDLDDAISLKWYLHKDISNSSSMADGTYEIGVHIADVTHFVKYNSKIDRIARDRTTTFYMVQKAIHMLPRKLSEDYCSLNENVDRLSVSIIWKMNKDGEEVGPRWYGKSVIRSKARLSYDDALSLWKGESLAEEKINKIDSECSIDSVYKSICILIRISQRLKERRVQKGSLRLQIVKMDVELDENSMPISAGTYQFTAAHSLVEEFMLLANVAVAEKISNELPQLAVLRRHPPPVNNDNALLHQLQSYTQKITLSSEVKNSNSFSESFALLQRAIDGKPEFKILYNMVVRAFNNAEYFCTGSQPDEEFWRHYCLSFPRYTHFTSPIRRYADIVVHRELCSILDRKKKLPFDKFELEKWLKNCNSKHYQSRLASERSAILFLALLLKSKCIDLKIKGFDEGIQYGARIVDISERRLDVLILELGLERKILLDHAIGVESTHFCESKEQPTMQVLFKNTKERLKAIQQEEQIKGKNSKKFVNSTNNLRISDRKSKDYKLEKCQLKLELLDSVKVWLKPNFNISPCDIECGLTWINPETHRL